MPVDIKIPSVGESITEVIIDRWLKKNGDVVQTGEPIAVLETDKATPEITAPAAGVLAITTPARSKIPVGTVVGRIDPAGARAAAPPPAAPPAPAASRDSPKESRRAAAPPPAPAPAPAP